ncbi:MAG: hypothetical protein ACXWCB_10100, partial [Acidimicrobiales bacterium]
RRRSRRWATSSTRSLCRHHLDPVHRPPARSRHVRMPTVELGRRPSTPERLRAWLLMAPSRPPLVSKSLFSEPDRDDFFSRGDGADWAWYPMAGSITTRRLSKRWELAGPGASALGSVTRKDGRVRFVPNDYWQRKGIPDWEREIISEQSDGRWVSITASDGVAILRRRRWR